MQDAIHVGEIVQRKTWLMRSKETEVKKQLSMFVIFDAFRMPFLLYQALLRSLATLRYPHALHDGVTVVSSSGVPTTSLTVVNFVAIMNVALVPC